MYIVFIYLIQHFTHVSRTMSNKSSLQITDIFGNLMRYNFNVKIISKLGRATNHKITPRY